MSVEYRYHDHNEGDGPTSFKGEAPASILFELWERVGSEDGYVMGRCLPAVTGDFVQGLVNPN